MPYDSPDTDLVLSNLLGVRAGHLAESETDDRIAAAFGWPSGYWLTLLQ